MGVFDRITRNMHIKCTSRDVVVHQMDAVMETFGYRRLPEEEADAGRNTRRHSFFVSMLNNGWISIFNDDLFAKEEIIKRLSRLIETKGLYLWAEESVAWGYSYYDHGELKDEFCSDIDELYVALFDSPPTEEERTRASGKPELIHAELGLDRVIRLEYFKKLYGMDSRYARGCMVKFASLAGIELAGHTFVSLDALDDEEKYGRLRLLLLSYAPRGGEGS